MASTSGVVVSYWWNGWKTYGSAALQGYNGSAPTASFKYVPATGADAGKTLLATGTAVPYDVVRSKGATTQLPPGARYFVRTGTVGPSIFAISGGEGSQTGFDFSTTVSGAKTVVTPTITAPTVATVEKKSVSPSWLLAALPLGLLALLFRGKK